MENNKTMSALDNLYDLIKRFQDEYDILDTDRGVYFFKRIVQEINDADKNKQISKEMAEEYREILRDFQKNPRYRRDAVDDLMKLNNRQTKECEEMFKKLDGALDWSGNVAEYVDKQNDTPEKLHLIEKLLKDYDNSYNQNGEIKSADYLVRIGNEIKQSLEEGKMSRQTADELMAGLQELKEDYFNKDLHDDKMQKIQNILQDKLENRDSKQAGPTGIGKAFVDSVSPKHDASKQEKGGIVGTIANDAAVLANNISRTVKNIVRGIKDAEKKMEDKALKKAQEKAANESAQNQAEQDDNLYGFNLGEKPQQREKTAKDIVQSQTDDKRKLEQDLQQKDKAKDKQGLKKENPEQIKEQDEPVDVFEKYKDEYKMRRDDIQKREMQGAEIAERPLEQKPHGRYKGFGEYEKPEPKQDNAYLGFGKRQGRDTDAKLRAQEDNELAPKNMNKASKLRDAAQAVVDKREHEKQEKTEGQQRLFIKKLFKQNN